MKGTGSLGSVTAMAPSAFLINRQENAGESTQAGGKVIRNRISLLLGLDKRGGRKSGSKRAEDKRGASIPRGQSQPEARAQPRNTQAGYRLPPPTPTRVRRVAGALRDMWEIRILRSR
ncbi:hypothetical protein H8959_015763, partial [Pygathrix nigripes]